MHTAHDRFIHTATDLTDFLACSHLTQLEVARVRGGQKRASQDEAAALIAAKGLLHEARYLQQLQDAGTTVIDLSGGKQAPYEAAKATRQAILSGAEIIYQATFCDGDWLGRADFLRRVERPGTHTTWSYEVIDTKLSLSPRPAAIIQLCMYSELLERVQGVAPEMLHIMLGDARLTSYRVDQFSAYYRMLKTAYIEQLNENPSSYPLPVAHCAQCTWSDQCSEQLERDNHLSLVAWMRSTQIRHFEAAGITTMQALAEAVDDARPIGIGTQTFARLRRQAVLQSRALEHKHIHGKDGLFYELLPLEESLGFRRLPPASYCDVYFDMEGDPLYEADHGLEYLFGNYLPENDFAMFWAYTPEEEQQAFERCVDFFLERLARDPQMHVYHYAPYEKVALRRLALVYNTRIDEVDRLLRMGIFVDLYAVVRQSMMISQPSYSIKKLEPFYGFLRKTDVKKGDDSILAFEHWRAKPERRDLLDDIQRYNEDDCRSTYELRCWLDILKHEAEQQFNCKVLWHGAQTVEDSQDQTPTAASELELARRSVVERLASHPSAREEYRMLSSLIAYHAREAKPTLWEYYDRCENADSLTEDDGKALGSVELDSSRPPVIRPRERTPIYAYTFPPQKFDGEIGEAMHDAYLQRKVGTLEQLDYSAEGGVALLKLVGNIAPESIRTLIPFSLIPTEAQETALVALGERYAAAPELPKTFVTDILAKAPPRLRGVEPGSIIQPKVVDGLAIADCITRLQESYLVVQGPPGTGKTTKGANAIVHLLSRGLRVGITARSHAAIDHLLAAVDRIAQDLGVVFRGVRKPQDPKVLHPYIHQSPNLTVQTKTAQIFQDNVQLVAGTSWAFVGKDVPEGFLDVLVIEEAGQFSLADTLALNAVAKNLVLLGDPLQLKQVARGTHPPGADASVLEHLLGEHATIPPNRGIFLDVSYRMHPEICRFISQNVYDSRLESGPNTRKQRVDSPGLSGSGLRFAPLEHTGNSRDSEEEAQWICRQIQLLLQGEWTDQSAESRSLTATDILVVTPYNAQRGRIERLLRAHHLGGVQVGTVDRFQGQEAPVIFYSMATSTGEDLPRDIAFLYERNRFNVAISRAKALCVLVASPALLRPVCHALEDVAMVNLLCRYAEEAIISAT